jgi:hypothetical protein
MGRQAAVFIQGHQIFDPERWYVASEFPFDCAFAETATAHHRRDKS